MYLPEKKLLVIVLLIIFEVIRRFLNPIEVPDFYAVIVISFFALAANSVSLYLLMKHKLGSKKIAVNEP